MNWVKKIFDRIGAPAGASIAADIVIVAASAATAAGHANPDPAGTAAALLVVTRAGNTQVKVTTVNLHQGAGAYDLATCATQAIIVDSLTFSCRLDLSADAGAITGISIQTNDTTPAILISAANGVKANLTAYAQLGYTGAIKVRVGNKIQCTIIGGTATASPTTCDVEITYHAVLDGGTL